MSNESFTSENYQNFDTYSAFNHLKNNGYTKKQAEAQIQILTSFTNANLATKHDLLLTKTELQHEMQDIRSKINHLRTEMQALGNTITIRLGAITITGIVSLGVLIKIL